MVNFMVSTCRSFRPPPYPPVKNVPALVSHDMMEGNRHTNKPKAMEDDDNTTETTKQRNNNETTKTTTTTTQPKQRNNNETTMKQQ